MSVFVAVATLALAASQAGEANSPSAGAATIAVADCYKEQVPLLDDGVSGADVIAKALVSACSKQLNAMQDAYKRKIATMARSTEGLSKSEQREQDRRAVQLLNVLPQQLQKTMEDVALTTVLRARKKLANGATN